MAGNTSDLANSGVAMLLALGFGRSWDVGTHAGEPESTRGKSEKPSRDDAACLRAGWSGEARHAESATAVTYIDAGVIL